MSTISDTLDINRMTLTEKWKEFNRLYLLEGKMISDEDYNKVHYGFNLAFDIEIYIGYQEGYLDEYSFEFITNMNLVKVTGRVYNITDFFNELRIRETVMYDILVQLMGKSDIEAED